MTAARAFLKDREEAVVLAATFDAAARFCHESTISTGLHRATLLQFAAELARPAMAELGLAPVGILGLEALAARSIYESSRHGELHYFREVAGLPGFPRALSRTLRELRMAGVRPAELAESGEPGRDLAKLLARYEGELEQRRLADLPRIFELATESAARADAPPPLHRCLALPIVLLDAPLESRMHALFFAALAGQSPAVLAAVIPNGTDPDAILQTYFPNAAFEDLDAPSRERTGTLEHLRHNVFSPFPPPAAQIDGRFEIFSSPGEGFEAVEIARRILKLSREGTPFDRIAVLLRNPERYQPFLEDAFRRARIPAFFTRGTSRPDPAGRAFLALLQCAAEKFSASRFAEYLSLAQVPSAAGETPDWVGPRDEVLAADAPDQPPTPDPQPSAVRAPWRWEKLLVDAAVIGGLDRWERRLKGLEREFQLQIENARRDDDQRRTHLERQLANLKELEQFALPLIALLASLPASAAWDAWIDQLGALAGASLRGPEGVLAVLAELEPMSEIGPVTLEEVAEVLSDRLRFLRRDSADRPYGRVFISSIEESRGQEFSAVFVPGLAEGLFPQRTLEDPLLLDEFRTRISQFLPTRDQRGEEERLRLRLALAAARDRLIASYPRMDAAESRPRVPSFYALELPRALEGRLPEIKEFERRASEAAPARLNHPAPRDPLASIDDAEFDLATLAPLIAATNLDATTGGGRYLVQVNEALARSLRSRWKRWDKSWRDSDGLVTSDSATLQILAQHRLRQRPWSPSSLQRFAECPYQFALHGIFGLRPRDEAEHLEQLDPLTRGALFHEVQFALMNALRDRALLPVTPDRLSEAIALADASLRRIADDYRERLAPAIPRVWASEIEELRTDLRGWLQHVAQNDDEWEPVHFEFAFGLPKSDHRDPASTDRVAELEEGVQLRGSIDLVEKHAARGLRVTDHKTGKRADPVPHFVGGGKLLQPLLYGLAARQILDAPVECGRLLYATQRGGYVAVEIAINDRSRQVLSRLLENIDACIANGFLPPAPLKDACERCDYRPVCGPYEERRFTQYKDRRDERLDVLTEIRGMP